MARYLSTNTLIQSAIRRASIPIAQVTFKEADFLAFANEEMDSAIVPYVMSFHEDHFVFPTDIPLEPGIIRYPIPYRAAGNKLRDVGFKDISGTVYEMTRISVEDIPYYQTEGGSSSSLRAFSIQNNEIVLTTDTNTTLQGSLGVYYFIRPNQLVSETRAMVVQNINRTTGEVTVDKVPDVFAIAGLIDFIQVKSPHKCLSIDIPITNIDSVNFIITFDPANIPGKLVIGDQICMAEECIIPQIPTDIHSLLAQRIAARCLEALGDQNGLQMANQKLAEMELKLGTVIDSRVDGASLKVVNRHSVLRSSRRIFRR